MYRLPNDRALLAAMLFGSFMALRGNREIAHIGQVTIDGERFKQFRLELPRVRAESPGGAAP